METKTYHKATQIAANEQTKQNKQHRHIKTKPNDLAFYQMERRKRMYIYTYKYIYTHTRSIEP